MTILIPLMLAATLSAGNQEFDASARMGALRIFCQRESARLKSEGPAKGVLKAKMLADPSKYDTVEKAREAAEGDYRLALNDEYGSAVGKAASELDVMLATDGCFAYGTDDDRRLFEKRFAEERRAACEEQAKTIAANVKPAEGDFGVKDEKTIRAELEGAVIGQQRAAVFEENRKYISEKIVDPIMESAKRELGRQREYLKRTRCEAYAPSALEKELAENLGRNVVERNSKNPENVISWGVFPIVVEAGVKEVAEKRTLERVAHAIDDVEVVVDADFVRGRIAADPVRHHKASDSEQEFRTVFANLLSGRAIDKVVADAPVAEREEFKEFVRARAGEASLGKAVDSRVRREFLPLIREVRGRIAAEDAAKLWPTLMDGTWYPEPSLADDVCSRSDYAKALKRWRDSPELVTFAAAGNGRTFIEETEKLADVRVAHAFDLARSAINAQNAVLDKVVPEVLGEAKERKESWFRRTPDLKKIVGMLTSGVEAKWGETRESVLWAEEEKPANAADQHRELFPSVRKRIELLAKTILEEMERPEPEDKPEIEDPPEEPPEDSSPSETETPPEEMEFTISVKKSGEMLEMRILRGKSALFERSCPARRNDFRTVSGALTDKLVEILELK